MREVSVKELKWLAQVYIASNWQSWDLELSLPIPCPGMPCYLAYTIGTLSMSLHVTCCLFTHPTADNTMLSTNGQSPAADLIWLYACPHFEKQGTTSDQITLVPIIASCADRGPVGCRWENLSSYILTVFLTTISGQLFQCSAINQSDCSFPLTVNSTNEFSIISPSIRKISKMQTWSWWFTQ